MLDFCEKAPSCHFGGIVSMFAILHLNPAQQLTLFHEIHRILAKDGLLLITTLENASAFTKNCYEGEPMRVGYLENYMN
jgi:cyclopropane fatty-acyl-phospholipid synthase-like methyltransferase